MARISGETIRLSEYEGVDLVEKMLDEKEDFLFGLHFQARWARRR